MKRQRGQAIILVLILLAVGSFLIVPNLQYIFTGIRSQSISENIADRNSAADGAVEDVLRQMLASIQGGGTPEESYEVEFGAGQFGLATVIEIPFVPPSEWYDINQGQFKGVMVEVVPPYLDANAEDSYFHYVVRLKLSSVNAVTNYGFTLPLGVEYVTGSSYRKYAKANTPNGGLSHLAQVNVDSLPPQFKWNNGTWDNMSSFADPTISPDLEDEDRWALEWTLSIPETWAGSLITVCQVYGNPPGGVCYIEPWFDGEFEFIQMEPCAGLGYGFYIVTIEVEGVTYEVIVAYDALVEGGGWNIISYRIVN